MDFEEWAADRVMSSMEREFAHAAWEDSAKAERHRLALLAENRADGWHSLTATEIRNGAL